MARASHRLLWLACAIAVSSGCGYALAGRGNALPASVVSIGIPQFINQSIIGGIDRPLTDAVRAEFQTKGKYRILPQTEGVDAVLTGRIVSVTLQPVAFTDNNQVSRNSIVATAAIEFREVATDRVIWANPSFQVRDEYDVTTGTSATDANALLTGNLNALERLSRTFARSVVTSIFESF
jgi:Lipopolysaccharide-assembly